MDEKPAPEVSEPLFPMLRRLGAEDVQRARAWLLAWLLDRLGQRVQEPPPASYYVERGREGYWLPVVGPFYRQWVATQMARELNNINPLYRYRVVGPDGVIHLDGPAQLTEEQPRGE
jgi:hypothetical protein